MQPHILKLNDHKYINISAISSVLVKDDIKSVYISMNATLPVIVLHLEDEIHTFLSYLDKISFRLEE